MAIGLAIVLLLAVLFVALVLDVGRWYMEDRRLQKAVDTVAMQYAMHEGYCAGQSMAPDPAADGVEAALVNQDLRNPVTVMNAVFGFMDREDGVRQFVTDSDQPEAFLLQARQEVPRSIVASGLFPGTVTLEKTAVARRVPVATFSVGSWLARIDSSNVGLVNALLGALVGGSVDLDLVSYQGLAAADVSLGDLLGAGETFLGAGVGTPEELLNADLTLGQLGDIFVEALSRSGQSTAEIQALLADVAVGALGTIRLADVLSVDDGRGQSALDAAVGLGELLVASLMLANERSALELDLDGLNISIPGVTNLRSDARVAVIEPPQIAIGRPGEAVARTAQVRLQLNNELDVTLLGIPLADVPLNVALGAAEGEAALDGIRCRTITNDAFGVGLSVATTAVGLQLGQFDNMESSGSVTGQSAVTIGGGLLNIRLTMQLDATPSPGSQSAISFDVSRDALPRSGTTGGGGLFGGIGSDLQINLTVLGVGLLPGGLQSLLGTLLRDLLNLLVATIIDPLLELLGLRLAGADVELIDVSEGPIELIL